MGHNFFGRRNVRSHLHRGTSNCSNTSPAPRKQRQKIAVFVAPNALKKNSKKGPISIRRFGNCRFGITRLHSPRVSLEEQIGFHFQTAILVAVNRNDHIQDPGTRSNPMMAGSACNKTALGGVLHVLLDPVVNLKQTWQRPFSTPPGKRFIF